MIAADHDPLYDIDDPNEECEESIATLTHLSLEEMPKEIPNDLLSMLSWTSHNRPHIMQIIYEHTDFYTATDQEEWCLVSRSVTSFFEDYDAPAFWRKYALVDESFDGLGFMTHDYCLPPSHNDEALHNETNIENWDWRMRIFARSFGHPRGLYFFLRHVRRLNHDQVLAMTPMTAVIDLWEQDRIDYAFGLLEFSEEQLGCFGDACEWEFDTVIITQSLEFFHTARGALCTLVDDDRILRIFHNIGCSNLRDYPSPLAWSLTNDGSQFMRDFLHRCVRKPSASDNLAISGLHDVGFGTSTLFFNWGRFDETALDEWFWPCFEENGRFPITVDVGVGCEGRRVWWILRKVLLAERYFGAAQMFELTHSPYYLESLKEVQSGRYFKMSLERMEKIFLDPRRKDTMASARDSLLEAAYQMGCCRRWFDEYDRLGVDDCLEFVSNLPPCQSLRDECTMPVFMRIVDFVRLLACGPSTRLDEDEDGDVTMDGAEVFDD